MRGVSAFVVVVVVLTAVVDAHNAVVRVRQNYTGPTNGWVTVPLYTVVGGGDRPVLRAVRWCAELFEPPSGVAGRDLEDCDARAILHAQIYPPAGGGGEHMTLLANGTVVSVDPTCVTGFWLHRTSMLVLEADLPDGDRLVQVMQVTRPRSAPSASGAVQVMVIEDKAAAAAVATAPTTHPSPSPQSQQSSTPTSAAAAAAANDGSVRAWVLWATAGAGLALAALTALVAVTRRRVFDGSQKPQQQERRLVLSAHEYLGDPYDSDYGDGISVFTPLSSSAAAAPESDDARRRRENLAFVMALGKGATPAFSANLGLAPSPAV